MKTCTIVFVALAALLLCTGYVSAMELCPQENCLIPSKCEQEIKNLNAQCFEQGTSCCSIVKDEFRTHCRHFGGECMDICPPSLLHKTVDCTNGQVCCVLV